MAALIEEEGLDEDGQQKKQSNPRRIRKRKRKQTKTTPDAGNGDNEDSDFLTSGSADESSSESGSDGSEGVIPNEEVSPSSSTTIIHFLSTLLSQIADILPSKTAPSTKRTKSATSSQPHKSKKACKATVEDIEDDNNLRNASARNHTTPLDLPPTTNTMTSNPAQKKKVRNFILGPTRFHSPRIFQGLKRSNPVYLFYELVPQNASGQPGDPGDKHYRCCHGNRKVLTVTKAMKSNLNGVYYLSLDNTQHLTVN